MLKVWKPEFWIKMLATPRPSWYSHLSERGAETRILHTPPIYYNLELQSGFLLLFYFLSKNPKTGKGMVLGKAVHSASNLLGTCPWFLWDEQTMIVTGFLPLANQDWLVYPVTECSQRGPDISLENLQWDCVTSLSNERPRRVQHLGHLLYVFILFFRNQKKWKWEGFGCKPYYCFRVNGYRKWVKHNTTLQLGMASWLGIIH